LNQNEYKVVIEGGYGLRNFGDDALMYAIDKKMLWWRDTVLPFQRKSKLKKQSI